MKVDDSSWTTEFKDLKKHLQKAFSTLSQCQTTMKALDSDCKGHIERVANLTEQYHCSSAASLDLLPMATQFPDLQRKLLYKIGAEISGEIGQIKEQVLKLRDCSESFTKQYEKCMQCYKRSTEVADLPNLSRKTPVYPSVSDMLLWLSSCERCLGESYMCKQYLLDAYTPDTNTEEGWLANTWSAGDTQLRTKIEDCMAYTHHFMELKLT